MDSFASLAFNIAFWTGLHAVLPRSSPRDWVEDILRTATFGCAAIIIYLELLGAAGAIHRWSVAALCITVGVSGAAVHFVKWRRGYVVAFEPPQPPHAPIRWSVAARIALALALWAALVYLLIGIVFPVEPISDAPIYHLPFVLQWLRTGSLELVPTPFGDGAATYFPANGELWLTWLMATGPNGSLVKVGQWPAMLLGALALHGIGRRCGADAAAAVFPAALWMCLPLTLLQSGIANVDLIWSAFYFVAVYFFLLVAQESPSTSSWRVASFALAGGIVCGGKTVGAFYVLLLLVPIATSILKRPRPLSRFAMLTACLLAPSAFWYARNLRLTGNPFYPVQLSLFGQVLADGWFAAAAMNASAYHLPVTDWRALLLRLQLVAGASGLLLLVVGIIAGWWLRRRSEDASRIALITCSLLAVAQIGIYWFLVPYNTQERFLLTAFGLALAPLAAVVAMRPWTQMVLVAGLVWQLVGVTSGPHDEWFTVIRLFDNPLSLGDTWVALCLPAAIAAAMVIVRRRGKVAMTGAAAVVAIGTYVSARPAIDALNAQPLFRFYPRAGFAARMFPAWELLERHSPPHGANVAYTGTNLPFYLRGIGFRNDVQYVNINRHQEWLLHDYHQALMRAGAVAIADDPYPQWYRAGADFDAWLANLRARDIEYVFIARENRHGRLDPYPAVFPEFPIEKRWVDAHPELFDALGPLDGTQTTIPWASVYRLRPQSVN